MVEVFKTDVSNNRQATTLVDCIHKAFMGYKANFDLDDCDHILRVECEKGNIETRPLVKLLNSSGVNAEVLPDEYQPLELIQEALKQNNHSSISCINK